MIYFIFLIIHVLLTVTSRALWSFKSVSIQGCWIMNWVQSCKMFPSSLKTKHNFSLPEMYSQASVFSRAFQTYPDSIGHTNPLRVERSTLKAQLWGIKQDALYQDRVEQFIILGPKSRSKTMLFQDRQRALSPPTLINLYCEQVTLTSSKLV